ncbi:MAG: tetratricopeptide repeat protein [Kiritimatiellia bacterium]
MQCAAIRGFVQTGLLIACLAVSSGCAALKPGGPPGSSSPGRAEALAHYGQGLIYQMDGDHAAASDSFLKAIENDPGRYSLYMLTAMSFIRQQKTDQAIEIIQKLCDREPRAGEPKLWLAFMYQAAGMNNEARETYRQLIKQRPGEFRAYVELATLYNRTGLRDEAIQILEDGAQRATDVSEILPLLAYLYTAASSEADKPEASRLRGKAIEVLNRAVAISPDDPALLMQLGDMHILTDQLEKAIECYVQVDLLEPDNLQVKRKLALSFAANKQQGKAIETMQKIAEQLPSNPEVYIFLGNMYENIGDKENAILNYRLTVKEEPDEAEVYLRLALLYLDNEPAKSIQTLEDGLSANPGSARLTELMAYTYLNQTNYGKAVEYFKEAEKILESATNLPSALFHMNYAVALQFSGEYESAAERLGKAVEENSDLLGAYMAYMLRQDDEATKDAVEETLQALPARGSTRADVLMYLGLLYNMHEEYREAISQFELAETLHRETGVTNGVRPFFYFWYGASCERDGQFDRAVKLLEKCIALDPSYADAYNYLAYMWAEKGIHLTKALRYVKTALKSYPENAAYLDTLGWIYFKQGKYAEALEQIEKALSYSPDEAEILDHLGDVYLKLGDKKKAVEAWKRAAELSNNPENIREKLKQHQR